MNRAQYRKAVTTCCLLLSTLLSACGDAGPAATTPLPSPVRAPTNAQTSTPASAPGTATPGPVTPTASASLPDTPTAAAGPTGTNTRSAFQPGPCPFQTPVIIDITCGTLSMPEDHRQPDGRRIKLAVAILKSSAGHPAADPVVFLHGGPGDSVLGHGIEPAFYPFLASRDVILFDQRGVGLSQPALDCPEVDQVDAGLEVQGVRGRTDPGPDLQPALACRDRLAKQGVNLADYNTVQNAADVEALRQALGYAQWNLFGISYGTRLALTVMRDFPSGVRSAILDSPLPLQVTMADRPANVAATFDLLFAACAADAACNHAYPNLKGVFYELVDKLDKAPVPVTLGQDRQISVTGDKLIGVLFGAFGRGDLIPQLPKAIYKARAGDFSILIPFGVPPNTPGSTGQLYSVWCGEQVLPAGLDKLTAADNAYPQLHHVFSQLDILGICTQWGVPREPESESQPVRSAIPTLILSGRFDARTPPAYAAEIARTLSNSYLFTVPALGHVATQEPCAMTLAVTFLDNPNAAPSAPCFAALAGPQWEVGP